MSIQLAALLINLCLAVLKFTVGALASSRALIADAFNSAGDVFATLVAWLAFRYGRMPPDENHPYGHGNAEALAGLLIGGMLCATGGFISIDSFFFFQEGTQSIPEAIAIYVAGATAVIKEALYRVSMRSGKRSGSPTLLASARDHRADVVTALGAALGVWIARSGYPQADAITGSLIGIYIFFLGLAPVRANVGILMQEAPPEMAKAAQDLARAIDGVGEVGQTRVQPMGGSFRMDMILTVAGSMRVDAAHELAHRVEKLLMAKFDRLTEVHVHIEPISTA